METIQLTIDEPLMAEMREATNALQMSRSDFLKLALERALRQRKIIELEIQDARAYAKKPQQAEEIAEWESEQYWDET
ncbi:MAG: ribbon-helix-helix protein, CopG family [Pyrinomonadaceae bacterium]